MRTRFLIPAMIVLATLPSAWGHYHFLQYLSRTGPFVPVYQKFNLDAFPNRTVNLYISDQVYGLPLAANDSVAGVISQIALAARTWSGIANSELRLAFGGVQPTAAAGTGSGIEVLFTDDMPPGLCGQGGPVKVGDPTAGPNGIYAPIQQSLVMLPRNLCGATSFSENFFQTATHEIGHAIGLQHTFTSSAMSTQVTRSTSKAMPLTDDDRAGVSVLYPTPQFAATTGSMTGRVLMNGQGVAMASVVAIRPGGDAISTLTHPDGSFRIDGIPPAQYFVYAHPLPPAFEVEASPGNIVAPLGPDGRAFGFGSSFETQFFPGSKDPTFPLAVMAGGVVENVNFHVQPRSQPAIHSVQTYGFYGQVTTKPPTLNRMAGSGSLVAAGNGLVGSNGAPAPGLSVTPVGGAAAIAAPIRAYPYAASYVQMDFVFNPFASDGPQHLIFHAANDIYVLPSAFRLVSKAPPVVQSVQPAADSGGLRQVVLTGSNLSLSTDILFDGLPVGIRAVEEGGSRALAVIPPAPAGHRASVVALAEDGQSSLYVQGNAPATYFFESGDTGSVMIQPSALAAGAEAMLEVTAPGANFVNGAAQVTFSSTEIAVRKLWVVSPTRLLLNVSLAQDARPGMVTASVHNGLQVWTLPFGFTVQTAAPWQAQVTAVSGAGPIGSSGLVGAGAIEGALNVRNLPAGTTAADLSITLNDQPALVLWVNGAQVLFSIPASMPSGPVVLRLRVGSEAAPPIVYNVNPPPPAIVGVTGNNGAADAAQPFAAGEQITLMVSGLTADDYTGVVSPSRMTVTVAGVEHRILQVSNALPGGLYQVIFLLRDSLPAGAQPVVISLDGVASAAAPVYVR